MKAVEAVIGSAAGVQPWLQQNSTSGCGVVYKLDATGQQTPLYSFRGVADGANPWAGVIRDSAGNLYGTTGGFGTPSAGVVYKLNPNGHETVLYSFCSRSNVVGPHARGANHSASVLSQLDDLVSGWGGLLDVSADQAMAVRCALRALVYRGIKPHYLGGSSTTIGYGFRAVCPCQFSRQLVIWHTSSTVAEEMISFSQPDVL